MWFLRADGVAQLERIEGCQALLVVLYAQPIQRTLGAGNWDRAGKGRSEDACQQRIVKGKVHQPIGGLGGRPMPKGGRLWLYADVMVRIADLAVRLYGLDGVIGGGVRTQQIRCSLYRCPHALQAGRPVAEQIALRGEHHWLVDGAPQLT
ncbi:MAG: hypothetical protein SNJ58_04200 [Aggregatilineales bacterium]